MHKKALRREVLLRRSALTVSEWQRNSGEAQKRLQDLNVFKLAIRLALYAPLKYEVDTGDLFKTASSTGKQVLYPLVCGGDLYFYPVSSIEQLEAGSFGILEPCQADNAEKPGNIDLMVVPGVAFDTSGHRVGFGKGYYDRYLAGLDRLPILVGFCHDFQLLENVPSERHDIRMDYVVTESRVLKIAVTDRI